MAAGADHASSWTPVVAYSAVSAANQMLWLTYTPITTDAARHYGVSEGAIGWLAEIFPLLYVVLALPAGRLIDRRMPVWLGAGAVLTGAGGVARLLGDSYAPVIVGQVLVAVAQPLVLNAVTSVTVAFLRPRDRATGIAVSSAGIFSGMVLALALGAALGTDRLAALLVVQAGIAVATAIALCVALRRPVAAVVSAGSRVPLRRIWAQGYLRRLIGLACVGFGVFVALTTWLQVLLEPAGVSEATAGYLLLALVLAGVLGSAALPAAISRRRAEVRFVLLSIAAASAGFALLAVAPGTGTGLAVCIVAGAVLLTDLPVILELAERRAGPAGGTASALIWMAGNGAGLVAALGVGILKDEPAAAFAALAGLLLCGVPLLRGLRTAVEGERSRVPVASEAV